MNDDDPPSSLDFHVNVDDLNDDDPLDDLLMTLESNRNNNNSDFLTESLLLPNGNSRFDDDDDDSSSRQTNPATTTWKTLRRILRQCARSCWIAYQQLATVCLIPCYLRLSLLIQTVIAHPRFQAIWTVVRRMGHYLAYFTLFAMLMMIPWVLYKALKDHKLELAAFHSAFIMTSGTIILSLRLVYLHLSHWYMPQVQKYVVRILWMVPLYSMQSLLSLRFHSLRIYIDSIRDLYEAFVIASFVYYLMELLGGQEALTQLLLQKRETNPELGRHVFPLKFVLQQDWELGPQFLTQCKQGALQYVVTKVFLTLCIYSLETVGLYQEGTFTWFVAYPYLVLVQNLSVMYALYCLVLLYNAVQDELRHPVNWNPLGKFLCVKGVVFFCWWQGVLIFWLRSKGIIGDLGNNWSSEDVAYGLIDYCIVIEMVGFAIAHSYTFTYKEYLPSNIPTTNDDDDEITITFTSNPQCCDEEGEGEASTALLPPESGAAAAAAAADPLSRSSQRCLSSSSSYRPPATLDQPMKFQDAFFTSVVPHETIQDISDLRLKTLQDLEQIMRKSVVPRVRTTVPFLRSNRKEEESGETAAAQEEALGGGGGGNTADATISPPPSPPLATEEEDDDDEEEEANDAPPSSSDDDK